MLRPDVKNYKPSDFIRGNYEIDLEKYIDFLEKKKATQEVSHLKDGDQCKPKKAFLQIPSIGLSEGFHDFTLDVYKHNKVMFTSGMSPALMIQIKAFIDRINRNRDPLVVDAR
jgi:hypothetical protein